MERSRREFSLSAARTFWAGARASAILAAVAGGAPLAVAMPKASGSNCGSDWVNNEGALECFISGENDMNNGVSNPHYVACTPDGEVFCCFNDKRGAQICESQAGSARANVEQQVRAILEGQRASFEAMDRMSKRLESLENRIQDPNHKD